MLRGTFLTFGNIIDNKVKRVVSPYHRHTEVARELRKDRLRCINDVIEFWLKKSESEFEDAIVCGLSALICSCLTLKARQLLPVKAV